MAHGVHAFVRDVLEASVTELFGSYGLCCDLTPVVDDDASACIELGSIAGWRIAGEAA